MKKNSHIKPEEQDFIEELILRELSYYDNLEQDLLFDLVKKGIKNPNNEN